MTHGGTVLISGMFDMDNYGDLLFPLIARHRLEPSGHRVQPVAPSARPAAFPDAMAPVDLAEMMNGDAPIAGVVIGGGYIIHMSALGFLDRYNGHGLGNWCGAGIWMGATLAAALRDVPVVWNAPGVPHPFSSRQAALVGAAVGAASYVAVRDAGSRALLPAPDDVAVQVVPDPVLDLPALWSRADLAGDWRRLVERKRLDGAGRFVAVHVRNRSIAGLDRDAFAAALSAFAVASGLTPMLVAVGESHDDPAVARDLARRMTPAPVLLDDPLGLREITAALAHATLYVGASLHGYVAATAYGNPGVLVGRPSYNKFTGFLEQVGRLEDFAHDWDEAFARAMKHRPGSAALAGGARAALDTHWQRIVQALSSADRHGSRRRDFAMAVLAAALRQEGPGWAMAPLLNSRMRAIPSPTPHTVPSR